MNGRGGGIGTGDLVALGAGQFCEELLASEKITVLIDALEVVLQVAEFPLG